MANSYEKQYSYKFTTNITTPTATYTNFFVDKITIPDRKGDVLTRSYVGGTASDVGPMKYSECTLQFVLEVSQLGGGPRAAFIKDIQNLISNDEDSCDIEVYLRNRMLATDADETNSYIYRLEACKVTNTKFDDLDSLQNDLTKFTVMVIPNYIDRFSGQQMP